MGMGTLFILLLLSQVTHNITTYVEDERARNNYLDALSSMFSTLHDSALQEDVPIRSGENVLETDPNG